MCACAVYAHAGRPLTSNLGGTGTGKVGQARNEACAAEIGRIWRGAERNGRRVFEPRAEKLRPQALPEPSKFSVHGSVDSSRLGLL